MLDKFIEILLLPAYIAGLIMTFGWNIPKYFKIITINTYKERTKWQQRKQ